MLNFNFFHFNRKLQLTQNKSEHINTPKGCMMLHQPKIAPFKFNVTVKSNIYTRGLPSRIVRVHFAARDDLISNDVQLITKVHQNTQQHNSQQRLIPKVRSNWLNGQTVFVCACVWWVSFRGETIYSIQINVKLN